MENLAEIVGKNLASLRKAKGLTQQDLAREINYSDKSISKWELGYSLPSVDILKDFAQFYGVSIDYLVVEQKQEDLEAVAANSDYDADLRAKRVNQALVIALTATFVFLVALSVYLASLLRGDPSSNTFTSLFFWMVPVSIFLIAWESWRYYHSRLLHIILLSVFAWTLLLCFSIHFQFYKDPPESIWYILIVGIPIQVILILWGNFKPRIKKKAQK